MNMPSRVAFNLFGKDIYWYGVIMAAAMIIAVGLAYSEERRKKTEKGHGYGPVPLHNTRGHSGRAALLCFV